MRVLGLNGIHTHGEGSTDLLLGQLAPLGFECVDVRFPKRIALECRRDDVNAADAWRVLCLHQPGDYIVAHSRGCLVANFATYVPAARFSQIFLFAPAVEADRPWGPGADRIHVIHNPEDPALKAGRLLPDHPFGDLGLTGYNGPADHRVKSFEWRYPGHSHYFLPAEIIRWARYIQAALQIGR